ncbi:hypothetical protein MTR67_034599 [Solanum verrucosum]|uniref:Uncharacterized protein n=1 Tax=Solanum verrucosum TaxID=315347 RepID=A0AAF0U8N1_SOLVR|nr:hypothetical protein MTR67_034599 [Solanum verrucosum]
MDLGHKEAIDLGLHCATATAALTVHQRHHGLLWESLSFTSEDLGTRVKLSTAYHRQMDEQAEHTIQTLEDMLRACVDFKGPELVHEAMEKFGVIRERLEMEESLLKSYVDVRRRDLDLHVNDWVYLNISLMKYSCRSSVKDEVSNPKPQGENGSGSSLSTCVKCGRKHEGDNHRRAQPYPSLGSIGNQKQNRLYSILTRHVQEGSPDVVIDHFSIFTPVGESSVAKRAYQKCLVSLSHRVIHIDHVDLDMLDFDIILGTDWMPSCFASIDSKKMISKECIYHLIRDRDMGFETRTLEVIPVINEFREEFPGDLPSVPPEREIDSRIGLLPNIHPISIPPYQMAPTQLKEL